MLQVASRLAIRSPGLEAAPFKVPFRIAFSTGAAGAREKRSRKPQVGLNTPLPDDASETSSASPFYFETGFAGWAKRPSRPFPPPFFSPPSGSFSDPLSTHDRAADRRPKVNGKMIRGITIGDDAVLASENLIGANDGVGAWAQRERGHAPLWSRFMLHFWALAAEKDEYGRSKGAPDPIQYLDEAYAMTKEALSAPNEWQGTTTACSALLHHGLDDHDVPMLYVTQLGDCKCLVIRPDEKEVIFATKEQWHYFDCPRQLGTNSPDQPKTNAVLSQVIIRENDVVLAMSDGVTDNLWEEEISDFTLGALDSWKQGRTDGGHQLKEGMSGSYSEGMRYVAQELVLEARKVAEDPFAASPFMERAVEEGLAIEGGKLDDISVVAALCRRRKG